MSSTSPNRAEADRPPSSPTGVPAVAGDENLGGWALGVVLVAFCVGVVLVAMHHWRRGAVVMGGAVGLAGLLRLVLPERLAGLLVVRSKAFDVITCGLAGATMMVLGMIVPGGFAG